MQWWVMMPLLVVLQSWPVVLFVDLAVDLVAAVPIYAVVAAIPSSLSS
jgi:hypothetical protein